MKAFGEAVGLVVAILAIVWGALIWTASPDRKPVFACYPVYFFSTGVQTTGAAAASANASSTGANASHTPTARDEATGRTMSLSDRVTLGCLRFTDRLFNR